MRRCLLMCLILFAGCSHAYNYRHEVTNENLRLALRDDVKPGMSRAQVESLLGPGMQEDAKQHAQLIRATRKFTEHFPVSYPQGVEESDSFLGYYHDSDHNMSWWFQFRNDRLINYDPREFENPNIF